MFDKSDVVFTYTDAQALEDGVLVDISSYGLGYGGKNVNRVTSNLMRCLVPSFFGDDVVEEFVAKLAKMHVTMIVSRAQPTEDDWLLTSHASIPHRHKVWLVQNEVGGYTVMLPEDY